MHLAPLAQNGAVTQRVQAGDTHYFPGALMVGGTGVPIETLEVDGIAALKAQASSPSATATYGKVYVKTDKKLYYKDADGVEFDLAASSTPGGANTNVQFNNGGVFGGSASFTWNGTTLTTNGLSVTGNTTIGDAVGDLVTVNSAAWALVNPVIMTLPASNPGLAFHASNGGIDTNFNFSDAELDFVVYRNNPGQATLDLQFARGTRSAPVVVQNNDDIGLVEALGYDGAFFRHLGSIKFSVDGTPGSSDMPGRIVFSTTPDGSASEVERMRITSTGNVGIGTTPTASLHLVRSTANAEFVAEATSSSNLSQIQASADKASMSIQAFGSGAGGGLANAVRLRGDGAWTVAAGQGVDTFFIETTNTVASAITPPHVAGPMIFRFNDATTTREYLRFTDSVVGAGTTVFNNDGLDRDFRIAGDNEANLFCIDGSTDRVGIKTATPGATFDIVGGSLAAGGKVFSYTATIASSVSSQVAATSTITTTSATGNSILSQYGAIWTLANGGWNSNTGNSTPLVVVNEAVGTGTWNPLAGGDGAATDNANYGFWSETLGSTAGTNIGGRNQAILGGISIGSVSGVWLGGSSGSTVFRQDSLNIGAVNFVTATKHGSSSFEKHLGTVGLARGGDTNVGGYFGLNSTTPSFSSAALIADNDDQGVPIFIGRAIGVPVLTLKSAGDLEMGGDFNWLPATDNTGKVGTGAKRFAEVHAVSVTTGDLEMKSPGDDGATAHWKLREERERIVAVNVLTGKRYALALTEITA